jgi:hypothetical protein
MTKRSIVTLAIDRKPTEAHDVMAEQMQHRRSVMVEELIAGRAIDAIFGEGSFNEDCLDEIEAPVRHPNDAMAKVNPIDLHDDPNAAPGMFKATLAKDRTRVADTPDRFEDPFLSAKRAEVDQYIASRRPAEIWPSTAWTPDRSAFPPAVNDNDILKFYPIFRIAGNLVLANAQPKTDVYNVAVESLQDGYSKEALVEARRVMAFADNLSPDQLEELAAVNDVLTGNVPTQVDEQQFDPAGKSNRELWDEYHRRSEARGSGSRHDVMDAIESAVLKSGGPEAVRKMKLYTELRSASNGNGAVSKMADDLAAKA